MKRLAKTIMAKSKGILRSISTGLSNGVLEAINGNVQAAKRKAKGYRSKRNLKAIVYLIAGDVLAKSYLKQRGARKVLGTRLCPHYSCGCFRSEHH